MADPAPSTAYPAKRLETASAPAYCHMIVNRSCLIEGRQAFKSYFDRWRAGEPHGEEEIAIRRALFRDGLTQVMACFTTNIRKRNHYLIPSEAFAGMEGWEEYYQWMLDLRDSFAAHNFGSKRYVEPCVFVHPETSDVMGVGFLGVDYQGEGEEAEGSLALFCNTAIRHVNARIDELTEALTKEANALSPEARRELPIARNVIPGAEDIRTGRDKYRGKTRGFEPPGGG